MRITTHQQIFGKLSSYLPTSVKRSFKVEKLSVIVSIVQFQHGFRLCSAGEPGYLDFDNLPETNFSCQGKVIGGYYADVEAGCQMFHVCTIGQKDEIMDIKFLCLNGTVFDQETRVCERVDEVDCSKSERFYNLNLELYGNNAVTLSLHDSGAEDEDDPSDLLEDHESQRTTSSRPSTTTSTTTTTLRPSISSTTSSSGSYQHPNGGYPQHFQPQPRFPSVQTSQSKSLYDDKNGGYHHQYIYHNGDHRNNNVDVNNDGSNNNNNNNQHHNNNNNQATSYQLFSNQGVSSTTGPTQIHQIRYSSTPNTQIQIHNDHQPTVSPIFHATSSTIQTLLNSNANSPALINPIFHNHGISSTTEQFTVHNNNPRETPEYRDDSEGDERTEEDRRPLEAIQPTTQGKHSKLTISPPQEGNDRQLGKNGQLSQQQRITTSFLPTPASDANQAVRSFYPTPRTSTKMSSSHVTHIHLPPPPAIPQLKPHQVTINLPPPDIQRIVQNPSPLLPSQSRVIVTAKASVSDESGRPLNSTQLVTLPLPTIPASYDDYKEGDESFDPFYRDVPKVRNGRRIAGHFRWTDARKKRSIRTRRDVEDEVKKTEAVKDSEIPDEKPAEKSEKEAFKKKGDKETQDEDLEKKNHLKIMTSKHRIDTEDEEKIDTKESDDEEYVELDEKSKAVVDSRETDAEEYVNSEEEMFKRKIFEDPESQTSKEVGVRAVAERDSKYSKDQSNRLDKKDKNSNSENSNSLGSSKRQPEKKSSRYSLVLPEVVDLKSNGKHSSKKSNLKDDISESKEKVEDDLEEEMEEGTSHENFSDDFYYYDADFDDSSHKSKEGDYAEYSKESPNKISSKHEAARHGKSSKKILNDEDYYDFSDDATTHSKEQIFSDETSGEYEDSRQNASLEDSQEVQDDEAEPTLKNDKTTRESSDETKTSAEQIGLSEKSTTNDEPSSQEDNYSDGVLKFTDEIPRSEIAEEPEEVEKSGTVEETLGDYVDDNYEPQNYKEQKRFSSTTETITTLNIAEDGNTRFADDEDIEDFTTTITPLKVVENIEHKQNDEARPEEKTEVIEQPLTKSIEKSIENEEASTIVSPASITEIIPMIISTTAPETTSIEILTTISTTTPATTTTISKTTTASTTTHATTTTISTTPSTTTTISTTPSTTTTISTTPSTTTTISTTPSTTTTPTRSTTPRPTPSRLLKPFTIRKTYVYNPPTTTPVPVVIKPRLPLLNPKPAKPIKSYNDFAPKPIIRKSPLFARKALIIRTTTPQEPKNFEDSTEFPTETTETSKIEETTFSLITTEFLTTQAPESSTPIVTTLPSIREDENSSIKDNTVPISITDNVSVSSATESQTFTPYPILRMTEANHVSKIDIPEEKKDLEAISTSEKAYLESNDVPNVSDPENSSRTPEVVTFAVLDRGLPSNSPSGSSVEPHKPEFGFVQPTSDSPILQSNGTTTGPEMDTLLLTTPESVADETTTEITEIINRTPTLASIKTVNRRPGAVKRTASFNCLEKEMYRFYADSRDCRLFHYCSPGFTSRQVLDFRFVCEEGTAFDEETQSCMHDVKSPKCRKRVW